jgi:hypothetical protein
MQQSLRRSMPPLLQALQRLLLVVTWTACS